MTSDLTMNELRAELPKVDLLYVRRNAPDALKQARAYDEARNAVDPADVKTIERARKAKARLLARVSA